MAAMPFPALPALLDSTQANFVAASRWVLPWTPRTCEFQYFPRELRERELWQLPDSSRGGSLSGVAAVAARRSIVLLLPQPGVGSRPCFQKEPPALRPVFDDGTLFFSLLVLLPILLEGVRLAEKRFSQL
ncbi:hypothetical protein T09_13613 [Trichinella sp. T9]|nr:hypothetical protein T09_13613 [Trichinella sp. T9]